MKSERINVVLSFRTESDAKKFCSSPHFDYMPTFRDARSTVRAALKRRRKARRDAKKAALVVERQGDSFMLKRDWK